MEPCRIIVTKYLGPTNTRGSRIVASVPSTRLTVSWDYRLNIEENHAAAATALARKLDWLDPTHGGNLPDHRRAYVVPFGVRS